MRQLVFALLLASLCSTSNAAECTDSEAIYADSLWDGAAATSACAPYVVTTNPVFIDAPCSVTSCINVMEGLADDLPACTFSGVSNKIELQNALTVCNGGDTTDPGSPTTVDSTDTTTTATTPTPTSSSTTDCSADEYQSTEDLYDAAAATSACSPYSTSSDLLVTFNLPCSATSCTNVLEQLAASLPDCLYDGVNEKAELTDNLGVCTAAIPDTPETSGGTTDTTTSTSPTPASTASSTGCTTTEANDMWDLYVSTATSDECAADSTVNEYSVYIFTSCDSECVDKVKDLAEALPNCYYEYEFMNKKQDVLEELDDCEESLSYYISVTVYPDSTVESTVDDTTSVTSTSTPISTPSGGSETRAPESGELPETTLDSSTAGTAESEAPPQIFALSFQVTAILLATAFLTF